MDPHRAERVSESLREELEELIGYEMADPRVFDVQVSDVQVSPDMRHAHVVVCLAGDAAARQEALDALVGARHFLRHQLAERLQLFRVPELHFDVALSSESAGQVKRLLRRIHKGRPKDQPEDEKNPLK